MVRGNWSHLAFIYGTISVMVVFFLIDRMCLVISSSSMNDKSGLMVNMCFDHPRLMLVIVIDFGTDGDRSGVMLRCLLLD